MSRLSMNLPILLAALLLLPCDAGDGSDSNDTVSKAEIPAAGAADQAGKLDPCEENGWYADGECDDGLMICHRADAADCGSPPTGDAPGCTDPAAYNYASDATRDDGSCVATDKVYEGTLFAILEEDLEVLRGVELVTGNLISQSLSVEMLEDLRVVEGDLSLNYAIKLETLSGLENLERIGGDLVINGNTDLHNVTSISRAAVGGNVQIAYNRALGNEAAWELVAALRAAGFNGSATVSDNDPLPAPP